MKSEVKKLLIERDNLDDAIAMSESRIREITNELCKIEGHCPQCRNWHYPHCGDEAILELLYEPPQEQERDE